MYLIMLMTLTFISKIKIWIEHNCKVHKQLSHKQWQIEQTLASNRKLHMGYWQIRSCTSFQPNISQMVTVRANTYYGQQIERSMLDFDWHIYIWFCSILKIKVKVMHIFIKYVANSIRSGKHYYYHQIGSPVLAFDCSIYNWPFAYSNSQMSRLCTIQLHKLEQVAFCYMSVSGPLFVF